MLRGGDGGGTCGGGGGQPAHWLTLSTFYAASPLAQTFGPGFLDKRFGARCRRAFPL